MTLDVRAFVAAPGRRLPIDFRMTPPADSVTAGDWTLDEIHVVGQAFVQLATIYLEVELRARITQVCGRCLEPVTLSVVVDEPFELPILPDSDMVDLMPTILQMIRSAHNPYVLCSKMCLGLCPTCGVNLNAHPDHACRGSDPGRRTLRDLIS